MNLASTTTLACLVLGMGCSTVQMHVSPSLASRSAELPLVAYTGDAMDARLQFGGFEVHSITQAPVATLTENNIVSQLHAFSFSMTDVGEKEWRATCKSTRTANGAGAVYNKASSSVKLDCTIENVFAEKPKKWRLQLAGTEGGAGLHSGEIRGTKTRLRIQSCHDKKADARALGFDVVYKDQSVAAVQTTSETKVWMHDDLGGSLESVVATSMAGLFLFDNLTKS